MDSNTVVLGVVAVLGVVGMVTTAIVFGRPLWIRADRSKVEINAGRPIGSDDATHR
jgi:hypothetical protein